MLENSLSPDLAPITSTLASKPNGLDLEQRVTPSHNPYEINDDTYRGMLFRHRKRRLRKEVSFPLTLTVSLQQKKTAEKFNCVMKIVAIS